MLRVGLSGTNWTGKTETINRLTGICSIGPVRTISLSSLVAKCPYPMMENQTIDGSKWMVEQVKGIFRSSNGEIEIFDRTPVDILAFTLYALERTGEHDEGVLDDCVELLRHFDRVFYLPPSEDWPVVVCPTESQIRFARQMDVYIRRAVKEFSVEIETLPWEFEERQRLLSEFLSVGALVCKGGL